MRFGMPWPGADVAREAEQAGAPALRAGDFVDHFDLGAFNRRVAAAAGRAAEGGLPRDAAFFAPPSFLVGRGRRDRYARASLALVDPAGEAR